MSDIGKNQSITLNHYINHLYFSRPNAYSALENTPKKITLDGNNKNKY